MVGGFNGGYMGWLVGLIFLISLSTKNSKF